MLAMYSILVISDCIATYHSKKKRIWILTQAQVTNVQEQKHATKGTRTHCSVLESFHCLKSRVLWSDNGIILKTLGQQRLITFFNAIIKVHKKKCLHNFKMQKAGTAKPSYC